MPKTQTYQLYDGTWDSYSIGLPLLVGVADIDLFEYLYVSHHLQRTSACLQQKRPICSDL